MIYNIIKCHKKAKSGVFILRNEGMENQFLPIWNTFIILCNGPVINDSNKFRFYTFIHTHTRHSSDIYYLGTKSIDLYLRCLRCPMWIMNQLIWFCFTLSSGVKMDPIGQYTIMKHWSLIWSPVWRPEW